MQFPQAPPTAPLRLVVADDNPVVRAGLTALLSGREDTTVVAEAADGREAYEAALRHRPDVILLDVRMPGVDGISALPHLVRLAPVMMLTYSHEAETVREALRLGAGDTWCTGNSARSSWRGRCGTYRRGVRMSRRGRRVRCCLRRWCRVRVHTRNLNFPLAHGRCLQKHFRNCNPLWDSLSGRVFN